jgi:hypothetical protein
MPQAEVSAHSFVGLFVVLGMIVLGLAIVLAGATGSIAAGVLFFGFRVVSWRGILAGVIGAVFLFLLG